MEIIAWNELRSGNSQSTSNNLLLTFNYLREMVLHSSSHSGILNLQEKSVLSILQSIADSWGVLCKDLAAYHLFRGACALGWQHRCQIGLLDIKLVGSCSLTTIRKNISQAAANVNLIPVKCGISWILMEHFTLLFSCF